MSPTIFASAPSQTEAPPTEMRAEASPPRSSPMATSMSSALQATAPLVEPGPTITSSMPTPLNEEVQFRVYTGDPSLLPPPYITPPLTTEHLIFIDVAVGDTGLSVLYAVSGDLTEAKWHLAEYDALVQACLRQDEIGSDSVISMLPEEALRRYINERYGHYLYFPTIVYPEEVREIHELYLSCMLSPKSYWAAYDPTDPSSITGTSIPTRINHIYKSYPCQKAMAEADHKLFSMLDQEGLYPLFR